MGIDIKIQYVAIFSATLALLTFLLIFNFVGPTQKTKTTSVATAEAYVENGEGITNKLHD